MHHPNPVQAFVKAILMLSLITAIAVPEAAAQIRFVRGDLDGNTVVDIIDIGLLAGGAPFICDDAADIDDDGLSGTAADIDYLTDFLFGPGLAPPAPFPACGVDPTADLIGCAHSDCGQFMLIRGDLDGDGDLTPLDMVLLANGPPYDCDDAADVDDDGVSGTEDDIEYLQQEIFQGGPVPPAPFPDCGIDFTPDMLSCGSNPCGITLCDCSVWGDVNGDDAVNPNDVVYMVNKVYRDTDLLTQHWNCPREAGDANCDDNVNPVDVVYYVNRVYKDQNAFCPDPCI